MAIPLAAAATGVTLTAMAKAILNLYGVASDINDFINEHIDKMKNSDNSTIARTGRVIEGAKFGFGIGYIVPVAIIAVGQLILGNQFAAVGAVASAAALSNPVAMTCAAVGAIFYGWNALSSREQNEILERLQEGLDLGVELLKSIITFVISKTKELLSAENIKEMKRFISEAANAFGKSLADVTGAIKDRVIGAVGAVVRTTAEASQTVKRTTAEASQTLQRTTRKASRSVKRTTLEAGQAVAKTLQRKPPRS